MTAEVAARVAAAGLDPGRPVPRHIAVIMDGNGRWARQRGLPRVAGHRAGVESVRACVRTCTELGVEVLTLYAFSTENWKRPLLEVNAIWMLLMEVLGNEVDDLRRNGVRVRVIGRRSDLSAQVRAVVEEAEARTEAGGGLLLVLALNYGSRQEIVDAVRRLCALGVAPTTIDEATLGAHLETAGLPDPDLVIRPSGEMRLSNFLLWQAAYSELVFTDILWPDFGRRELIAAVREYQHRCRRFGGLTDAE